MIWCFQREWGANTSRSFNWVWWCKSKGARGCFFLQRWCKQIQRYYKKICVTVITNLNIWKNFDTTVTNYSFYKVFSKSVIWKFQSTEVFSWSVNSLSNSLWGFWLYFLLLLMCFEKSLESIGKMSFPKCMWNRFRKRHSEFLRNFQDTWGGVKNLVRTLRELDRELTKI